MGESFRRVKRHVLANIANAEPGVPANLVMVTSPLANEGKTFCAINLAISMAMEMERTVLLVDADVAKPSVPSVLGLKIERGLMDVLFQQGVDLSDVLCRTNIDKLTLLPAGKGRHHATEMLASDAMGALLQEMAERYSDRIIIFDSPPLLAASESSVLATRMGQIVMVVEAGKTTETALKESLTRIESCRNVGLLLNKIEGAGVGLRRLRLRLRLRVWLVAEPADDRGGARAAGVPAGSCGCCRRPRCCRAAHCRPPGRRSSRLPRALSLAQTYTDNVSARAAGSASRATGSRRCGPACPSPTTGPS